MRKTLLAVGFACLAAAASVDAAVTPAFSVSGTPTMAAGGWNTKGFSFQLTTPVTVTELSFYGMALGGGDTPAIQLWDNSSTAAPLVSAMFPAGAFSGWRSIDVADLTLQTGKTYTVSGPCWWASSVPSSNITFAPEITSVTWTTGSAGGWTSQTFSTTNQSNPANPIFLTSFSFTPIPEPASIGLIAATALLSLRRRRD